MSRISPTALVQFMDNHADIYKTGDVEPDGYISTNKIAKELTKKREIDNPNPRPKVPTPISHDGLISVLTTEEIQSIDSKGFDLISEAISNNDRAKVRRLIDIARAKGWMGSSSYTNIRNTLEAEIDDPQWQAKVTGPSHLDELNLKQGIRLKDINDALGRV